MTKGNGVNAARVEDLERHARSVRVAVREYNRTVLHARRAGLDVRATLRKTALVDQQILAVETALVFGDPEDDVDEVIEAENEAETEMGVS